MIGLNAYIDTEDEVGYTTTAIAVELVDPDWKKTHLHRAIFTNQQSLSSTTEIHILKSTVIQEFRLGAE